MFFKRKLKYFVTVIGENNKGGTAHTDLYYKTDKPLNSETRIEQMRTKIKESLNTEKAIVIVNIFGPIK